MSESDPMHQTWQATMALRIVKPDLSLAFLGIPGDVQIQQAWQCLETGAVEWRDIPTVTKSEALIKESERGQ